MSTEPTVSAVILAAGKGTRMGSDQAKVLHQLAGETLVGHVLNTCRAVGFDQMVVVVGHQREAVEAAVAGPGVVCALQAEQLGTGHAVLVTEGVVTGDEVVVLCGDAPLVPEQLLRELLALHRSQGAACTGVGALMDDPTGYGRMITDADGNLKQIVEQRDASPDEAAVKLVNSGIFCFERATLFRLLADLRPENAQGEYYLTDVPKLLASEGKTVALLTTDDIASVFGINTPAHLEEAERLLAARG